MTMDKSIIYAKKQPIFVFKMAQSVQTLDIALFIPNKLYILALCQIYRFRIVKKVL